MLRDEIIAKLRAAMPALRQEFGLCSLSLFGSVARGDDGPESDIDVLAEFAPPPSPPPTLFTLARLQGRLSDLLGREVDVGTHASLRPALRAMVESEALRVA